MKRVLLTGASGFVGRNAIAPLLAGGYEVHAVTSRQMNEVRSGVIWHRADLLGRAGQERLMAEVAPSHLLHFAWYAEPGKFWRAEENFHWLEASLSLLRAFAANGGQRVVMAGTCAEYDWDYGYCSEQVTPRRPATAYGVCKNALYEVLQSYSGERGMSSAWGRIFFLYGPGEHPARLVSSVITALLRGEKARCTHGQQIRDFLHVEDVASAFVALLDAGVEGAVNIASGHPVSLKEVVLAAADILRVREQVEFGAIDAPQNEPPLLVGDCGRLSKEVCWHPHYDLESGMVRTVRYWQEKNQA